MKYYSTRSTFLSAAFVLVLAQTDLFAATRYFQNRIHSPITTAVVNRIRALVAIGASKGRHLARFIKVGDSISASDPTDSKTSPNSQYLCQFVCPDYNPPATAAWDYCRNLDTYKFQLNGALKFFLSDTIAPQGRTCFNWYSSAARVSQEASFAITGNPTPLRKEIDALSPQFAFVMYGANDAGGWGTMYGVVSGYMASMRAIVDSCIANGVVPILMSPCPRKNLPEYALTMGHLVRALAQQYQIPFVNEHRAMMPLPNHGLGGDGLHPSALGYNQCCWLTPAGLKNGYNLRNLLSLQALDNMYQITDRAVPSLNSEPASLTGAGTKTDPFIIDSISFVDAQTTSLSKTDIYYKLTVTKSMKTRTMVTYQNGTVTRISLLNDAFAVLVHDSIEGGYGLDKLQGIIEKDLSPGVYYINLKVEGVKYGDYQFLVADQNDSGYSASPTGIVKPHAIRGAQFDSPNLTVNSRYCSFQDASLGSMKVYNARGEIVHSSSTQEQSKASVRRTEPSLGMYFVSKSRTDAPMKRLLLDR